eukprot:178670_1
MLPRKVSNVLSERSDTQDLILGLETLSGFYVENTSRNRRKLRSDIEKRGLAVNDKLISAFESVNTELLIIGDCVDGLDSLCTELSARLSKARSETEHLIEKTEKLRSQKKDIESRQALVSKFLARFHLTKAEMDVLESERVDERTFRVFDRILEIRSDCRSLLQRYHQRAGLDIMDQLGRRFEEGFANVFRWAKIQSKLFEIDASVALAMYDHRPDFHSRNDSPKDDELNLPVFAMALKLFRPRGSYFATLVDEAANLRRVYAMKRFLDALTEGGPNGVPKPIDLHAHDPVRYVSDILAWLHQMAATERELALAMFSVSESRGVGSRSNSLVSDPEEVTHMLDRAFEGLTPPLEIRVNQALTTQPDMLLTFRILDILEFYSRIIRDLLSQSSSLRETLGRLCSSASKQFFALADSRLGALVAHPPAYTSDLSPPSVVRGLVETLKSILEVRASSLIPEATRDTSDLHSVLACILGPLTEATTKSAADGLDVSDSAVYLINMLVEIQSVLKKYDFTQSRFETVTHKIEGHMGTLITAQSQLILRKCGVSNTLTLMTQRKEKLARRVSQDSARSAGTGLVSDQDTTDEDEVSETAMSSWPGLDEDSMTHVMSSFCANLFSSGSTAMPQIERLSRPSLRQAATEGVSRRVYESYCRLYDAIFHAENLYSSPNLVAPRNPDEIGALLEL